MKKAAVFAFISAMLILTGCAESRSAQSSAPEPSTAAQTDEARQSEQSDAQEAVRHYELTTRKIKDEFTGEDGVKLASVGYAYPELSAVCEGGKGVCGTMPEEVQSVLEAFNQGVWDYVQTLDTAGDLGGMAQEQYNEMGEEYRQYFTAYEGATQITGAYEHGDLLEVQLLQSGYWGGAHGGEEYRNLHFDLKEGKFFVLSDVTDTPDRLHDLIAEDIINVIFDREEENRYSDGFSEAIRGREEYNVAFGEAGVGVIFDEYEIAPYASGMPEFTVPYEKIWCFLNERGRRLLALPAGTQVLGDYYDATELWYWFEGRAPLDYDGARTGIITNEFASYEMPYLRFDEPGIRTMADLRARLATRFTSELIAERLSESTLFREFDGVLYAAAAGRGTDATVGTVDYTVTWNVGADGGRILADIHRLDWDAAGELVSTGEIDQVEFPFALGGNGAIFSAFPTIW